MLIWVSFMGTRTGGAPEVFFDPNQHVGKMAVRIDIEEPHPRVYREGGLMQVPWVGDTARFHIGPGAWFIKGEGREHFEIRVEKLGATLRTQVKFVYWGVVASCDAPLFNAVSPLAQKITKVG